MPDTAATVDRLAQRAALLASELSTRPRRTHRPWRVAVRATLRAASEDPTLWDRLSIGPSTPAIHDRAGALAEETVPIDRLADCLGPLLGLVESWPALLAKPRSGGRYGRSRKRSGAYYTPRRLVDALIGELARVGPAVEPGGRVCDPACGTGAMLAAVAEHTPSARLFGVDLEPMAVELARLRLVSRYGLGVDDAIARIQQGDSLASWIHGPAPSSVDPTHDLKLGPPWVERFPEAMSAGGFDLMISNPPWERIKVQARELLRGEMPEAATAAHRADRERLTEARPEIGQALARAKRTAGALSAWLRKSGAYPLSAHGDINTFPLFVERAWSLAKAGGRVGLIVPTGLATDFGHRRLFQALFDAGAIDAFLDVINTERWFPDVDSRFRFALVSLTKRDRPPGIPRVATLVTDPFDLSDDATWTIDADTLATHNPESRTLPLFRTPRAATRAAKIAANSGAGAWRLSFQRMFDMTNDAHHFAREEGPARAPLFEGKMFWIHDGAYATFANVDGDGRRKGRATPVETRPSSIEPRFWVDRSEVQRRQRGPELDLRLTIRALTNPTNERTLVAALIPPVAVGNSALVLHSELVTDRESAWHWLPLLAANLNAVVLDDIARQKMGNTNVNMYLLRQLPLLPPSAWKTGATPLAARVAPLALGLAATSSWIHDLLPSHVWGAPVRPILEPTERRRAQSQIDVWIAAAYGLDADDLDDILGIAPEGSFAVWRRKETRVFGEFETRRLILDLARESTSDGPSSDRSAP